MRSFVLTRLQCRSVWPGLCFVLICSLLSLSSWSSWLVSPAFALTREASKTAGPEAAGPEAAGPEAAGRAQPLTVLSQDGRAHEFRVEVADSGPGLPDGSERIFDPFFSNREQRKGMGLGLSIVHGFVTLWGGQVYAVPHHKDLGGAGFYVEMPLAGYSEESPPE